MAEANAKLKYLHIAPRKARLLADMIRGMNVKVAEAQLRFARKKSATPVLKLLKSAISNARHNFKEANPDDLIVKKITVDGGPILKRYMPRARGRATVIRRRTSHINIILGERVKKL